MYRIRLHGRGGQGIKTAGRILGSAFFREGFEVQDAPRYGAERRGAPIFSYVRADRRPIQERGVIRRPDLVAVADDTLLPLPAAGVLQGADEATVLLLHSPTGADTWRQRLKHVGPLLVLPAPETAPEPPHPHAAGTLCAAAAACLVGEIRPESLAAAIEDEVGPLGDEAAAESRRLAEEAWALVAPHRGLVRERPQPRADRGEPPAWVDLPREEAALSAPAIHAAATSVAVATGAWRTARPVIRRDLCRGCWWLCGAFCPDGAVAVGADGRPEIDYAHCKGCLVCAAQCPAHAVEVVPETAGAAWEARHGP